MASVLQGNGLHSQRITSTTWSFTHLLTHSFNIYETPIKLALPDHKKQLNGHVKIPQP